MTSKRPGVPRLPVAKPPDLERAQDEFIAGAPGKRSYPWEAYSADAKPRAGLNVQITERAMVQIEWLITEALMRERRTVSKRTITHEALQLWLEQELERKGVPKDRR